MRFVLLELTSRVVRKAACHDGASENFHRATFGPPTACQIAFQFYRMLKGILGQNYAAKLSKPLLRGQNKLTMAEPAAPTGTEPSTLGDDAKDAAKIKRANAAASRDKHRQIEKAHRDVGHAHAQFAQSKSPLRAECL